MMTELFPLLRKTAANQIKNTPKRVVVSLPPSAIKRHPVNENTASLQQGANHWLDLRARGPD